MGYGMRASMAFIISIVMKKCVECGENFKPNKFTPYQIYCSRRCKDKVHRRRRTSRFKEKRLKLVEMLGGKCVACKTDDPYVLTLDHINNDRNGKRNSVDFIRKMLKYPEIAKAKLQVLCWNHNIMKFLSPAEFGRRFPHLQAKVGGSKRRPEMQDATSVITNWAQTTKAPFHRLSSLRETPPPATRRNRT